MLKNHLKIALRSLWKNKLYSSLNLLGLGFGMTCFLLLSLYLKDEWTFDAFHHQADRVYRVIETKTDPEAREKNLASVAFRVSKSSLSEFPEVENACALSQMGRMVYRNDEWRRSFYEPFLVAENSLLQLLSFQLLEGDPKTALDAPGSVILTREFARRLFGDRPALGKSLSTDRGLTLTVTGVLDDLPVNSHLQFPALISFSTLKGENWYNRFETSDWTSNFFPTYLKLKAGTDARALEAKLTQLVRQNYPADEPFRSTFQLQPLRAVHFHSAGFESDLQENPGNLRQTRVLAAIAFFILLMACINYINLATARSETYSREVGVRKVIGAGRANLVARFFAESLLLTAGAFLLALALSGHLLPGFNAFAGKRLSLDLFTQSWLLPYFLIFVAGVGLVAGAYPSLFLSRIRPLSVLKGGREQGGGGLRKALVVFQFALSTVMLIATVVAFRQMAFIRHKDLGFNKEQLVVVDINSGAVRAGHQTIKEGYQRLPAVQRVSVSNRVPGEWKNIPKVQMKKDGMGERTHEAFFFGADDDFLSAFEIQLLDGRNFDPRRLADTSSILVNEQAARLLGIVRAEGQAVTIPAGIDAGVIDSLDQPFAARVIGIVRDFHVESLHQPVQPTIIAHPVNPVDAIDYFTVRVGGDNVQETLASLERVLRETDPAHLFEYHFLDEQIAHFYENDLRQSRVFSAAAGCAILIACLGLFGLAAFTAERRTKEIGIRKVLGASVAGIVGLLSKDFLKLVVVALILAAPPAYIFAKQWLNNFAYRIELPWWVFAAAGALAIAVAFLTVSIQSVRVATTNPVKSLRSE